MTIPRRFFSNQDHAISRRCAERRFYIRPSIETMHLLLYALGRAMEGRRIALYVFSVQADHFHVVLTDLCKPGQPSDLPLFFKHFNSMVARGINHHLGRTESVWKVGSYHGVELHGPSSLLEQLLYAWIQPVKDGQARSPYHWPGLVWRDPKTEALVRFLPEGLGATLKISRPDFACYGGRRSRHRPPTDPLALRRWQGLRRQEERRERARYRAALVARARGQSNKRLRGRRVPKLSASRIKRLVRDHMSAWRREHRPVLKQRPSRSTLPKVVEIRIAVPPGFEGVSLEDMRQHFREELLARVEETLSQRDDKGLPPVQEGEAQVRAKVEATDPFASAGPAWPNPRNRRRLDTRGLTEEEARQVKQDWRAFRGEYKACLHERRSGNRDVAFPLGTYDLLANHQVRIAGIPP